MNRIFVLAALLTTIASTMCVAGTLEGKVSTGNSVVYVDAVPGKTFPAPTKPVLVSQRELKFVPPLVVVQQGTTVEFQNDDSVQHNVFWPSVGGSKKFAHNMGTWPKGDKRTFTFDHTAPCRCFAERASGDVRLHRGEPHTVLCPDRFGRQFQDRQHSGRQVHRRCLA